MCAECGFALSCWNMHGRPWKRCLLEGSILCSKISMYFSALMVPSQKCKLPLPRALTQPHTIITITCWHQLFQITSLFNQFTSLLALNCSCPNFFWNVLQVWMTGKDVYLQMTWSWPDKTLNILCSYCLQWNTSQSKFRNHYFLFLFAFSILSQLFLIWGCTLTYLATWKMQLCSSDYLSLSQPSISKVITQTITALSEP